VWSRLSKSLAHPAVVLAMNAVLARVGQMVTWGAAAAAEQDIRGAGAAGVEARLCPSKSAFQRGIQCAETRGLMASSWQAVHYHHKAVWLNGFLRCEARSSFLSSTAFPFIVVHGYCHRLGCVQCAPSVAKHAPKGCESHVHTLRYLLAPFGASCS